MEEYYEKALQKIKELGKMTEQEWNRIAYKENLLSTESLKYISGISFEMLCKTVLINS